MTNPERLGKANLLGQFQFGFVRLPVSVRLIRYSNRKKSVKSFLFLIKTEVDRFAKVH